MSRSAGRATRDRARRQLALVVIVALQALTACRSLSPAELARVEALTPRLGQLMLVGFTGTAADAHTDLERLVCGARVGGILIFGRNIVDAPQLTQLTGWMIVRARECGGPPLLVAVDAEGGRVMRLGPTAGWTPTPSHQDLGDGNDLVVTELEARRIGGMLRTAGINWNLAPVVDVGVNPANPVIVGAGRAFGADPARVAAHARAFIDGMHAAGLLTALKHFPGHGSSFADSHLGFVDVTDTADPETELAPYRALLAAGEVDAVMTAHVFNRRLDRRYPATLSTPTIEGLLRGHLGFRGVVVSDDLRMGAIEQHYGIAEAAVRAVAAGVDVLLIADDRLRDGHSATQLALDALERALREGRLEVARVETALARVATFKGRLPASAPR